MRLDLKNNEGLTYLECSSNNISELNLSKNTKLELLECDSNKLKCAYGANAVLWAHFVFA